MKNSKLQFKIQSLKNFIIFFLLIIFNFALLTFNLRQATAQTSLPLTVAPARQELTINPGESTAVNIRFYNLGESPISGLLKVADFVVEGASGTPKIIEEADQINPRFSASAWISLPYDRITIAAGDKVSFQARVTVPADAKAGGRYVAVFFEPSGVIPQAVGSNQEVGTGVSTRIASLAYIKVAGPTSENAIVSRFFTKNFFEYGPIEVETEVLNRGDYHIRPRGIISLTNTFGNLVAQEKLKEQNIFPDLNRSYTNTIGQKWMIGRYRLNLAASYGEKGRALTAGVYLWVFPWRVAIVIILAAIILVLLVKKLVLKENILEAEIEKEKEEIEKLKEQLRKKN